MDTLCLPLLLSSSDEGRRSGNEEACNGSCELLNVTGDGVGGLLNRSVEPVQQHHRPGRGAGLLDSTLVPSPEKRSISSPGTC